MPPADHLAAIDFPGAIAPLTPADFSALWSNRKLTLRRRIGDARAGVLLEWDTLRSSIEDGTIPPKSWRLTYRGYRLPPLFYNDDDGLNRGKLAHLFDQGASVIAVRLQNYLPAMGAIRREARTHGIRIEKIGAIATTGTGGALHLHFDPEDIVILQMEGSKRWCIYNPPVANPVRGMPEQTPPEGLPFLDTVLERGDLLFVPAGYWHRCDNGPTRSLHVALLLSPPPAVASQVKSD